MKKKKIHSEFDTLGVRRRLLNTWTLLNLYTVTPAKATHATASRMLMNTIVGYHSPPNRTECKQQKA